MFIKKHQDKIDQLKISLREAIAIKAYDKKTLESMNSILVGIESFKKDDVLNEDGYECNGDCDSCCECNCDNDSCCGKKTE